MIKTYDQDKCYYTFKTKKALEKWIAENHEVQHMRDILLFLYKPTVYYCFWECLYVGEIYIRCTTSEQQWIKDNLAEIPIGLKQRTE